MPLDHVGRGPKAAIAQAITDKKLTAGDIVVTNDEKGNELVLIERDNSQVIIKSRTQNDIEVLGVNLSTEVADGKTLPAGMDLEEFVKKLVQKRIAASYKQPTVAIANNGGQAATVVEAGSTVSVKLRSTFTAGDAGAITSHVIKRGATSIATGTGATLDGTESLVVPDGASTYVSTVAYAEGAIKNDNFGDASPNGHIAAGSKNSTNYVITGARKAFYGTGKGATPSLTSAYIRGLAGSKLNPTAGSTISVTIPEGDQFIVISLPSTRTLKQVTYVDLGDKGMLEKFTKSTVAVAGAGGAGVAANNSNTYVYAMAAPAAAAMNFEFLIQ